MSEWNEFTIGELPLTIGDGNYSSKYPSAKEFKTSGIPFISNKDIKNGRILLGDLRYITPEKHAELKKGHIKEHDILVSTRANIGDIAYVDASFEDANINAQLVFLRCDEKTLHSRFLYHLLSSKHYHAIFQNHASGSAQMQLPIAALREISITFPEFDEQKAIAAVLSSLDDKIDLLHRQNKTLEAMAATLFRQWFVEEAQKGGEVGKLKQYVDIGIGRTPPRQEHQWFSENETDVKWISIKDLGNDGTYIFNTAEYLTRDAVEQFNIPVIPENTVVLSFKMTVGRVAITTEAMLSNEAIAHFKFRPNTPFTVEYLYLFLKSYQYELLGSTSSIVTAINSAMIKDMEISIPDEQSIARFDEVASGMFQKVRDNQLQIRTLETLRDTLLPKLMSGEVRVALDS